MTDKQELRITDVDINSAMFSSTEGFVSLVVDSIEFELGRELTEGESQRVYHYVEKAITKGGAA
ncbi:TPA: hypothetical protein JHJ49_002860 [Citrobacter koseri]|nr:hypothetical protein [Citrobacter koseri]